MRIKSIVAGATIALIAGVGSVSAHEPYVPDTLGTPFAMLNGIETLEMSVQEMAAVRGIYLNSDLSSDYLLRETVYSQDFVTSQEEIVKLAEINEAALGYEIDNASSSYELFKAQFRRALSTIKENNLIQTQASQSLANPP